MSISVVGIAIGAIIATKVMSMIGRKYGFILAALGNALFSILAAYSIFEQNFVYFVLQIYLLALEWLLPISIVLPLLKVFKKIWHQELFL